jgi:hypothetical protein
MFFLTVTNAYTDDDILYLQMKTLPYFGRVVLSTLSLGESASMVLFPCYQGMCPLLDQCCWRLLMCPFTIRVIPSPVLLARHFFAVALYAIWTLFTHPRVPRSLGTAFNQDTKMAEARRPRIDEYPALMVRSVVVVSESLQPLGMGTHICSVIANR